MELEVWRALAIKAAGLERGGACFLQGRVKGLAKSLQRGMVEMLLGLKQFAYPTSLHRKPLVTYFLFLSALSPSHLSQIFSLSIYIIWIALRIIFPYCMHLTFTSIDYATNIIKVACLCMWAIFFHLLLLSSHNFSLVGFTLFPNSHHWEQHKTTHTTSTSLMYWLYYVS